MINLDNKKYAIILIIIIYACIIRLLFALNYQKPILYDDSLGYYQKGLQIVQNPTFENIISDFRTPLYPIFLAFGTKLAFFNDNLFPKTIDDLRYVNAYTILLYQSIYGIFGIIVFSYLLFYLGFSNIMCLFLSIFYASNIVIFFWERSIMTEGLASTTLLIFFFTLFHTIKSPKILNIILLSLFNGLSFLLRPSFLILSFIIFPILFTGYKIIIYKKYSVMYFLITSIIIGTYIIGNIKYHNYIGIQRIADIDILGKIFEYNISLDSLNSNSSYVEKIKQYKIYNDDPDPFNFLHNYNPSFFGTYNLSTYSDSKQLNELQPFIGKVILSNLLPYTTRSLSSVPVAMTDISPVVQKRIMTSSNGKIMFLSIFFKNLLKFYNMFRFITLLIFPLILSAIWLFIINRSKIIIFLNCIGFFIIFYIFLIVFTLYRQDYARLISPIHPLILIFMVGIFKELITYLNKNILMKLTRAKAHDTNNVANKV
jgi:hypothetical protein